MNIVDALMPHHKALADAAHRKFAALKPKPVACAPMLVGIADLNSPADLPVVLKALNDMAEEGDWVRVRKLALHVAQIAKNNLNEAEADEAGVVSRNR